MGIFDYIEKYGCYTFDEMEFNEVDNLIFSGLTYSNLKGIVSSNRFNKRTIKNVGELFFKNYDNDQKNITAIRVGIKILKSIMNKRRYENLKLYNYSYVGDDKQQFCAMCIDIDRHVVYVSFEGTDELVSGWREDFMMACEFPVLSQRRAIDYLNKHFLFNNKNIILGGHSKGGNLAMVAGMFANFWVKDRIINIYNNDGPGFRKKEIESKYFKSIEKKLIYIIPNYSIIGLLLRHNDDYKVVKSTKRSIYAHDMATWVVDGINLKESKLSSFSKFLDNGMIRWLDKYDDEEILNFVKSLFMVFERASIVNLVDILNNKKLILKLIMETKDIDKKTRKMLHEFVYVLFNYFKENRIDSLFGKSNV